jgi:hypothetical protein
MKRLLNVLVLALAVNFVVVAGAAGWLLQSRRIDRQKLLAIKAIVFPAPAAPTTRPISDDAPTTQPMIKLEELLVSATGRTASDEVDSIRHAFDTQMAQLDRRQRELSDLQAQVELAKSQLSRDRAALDADKKQFDEQAANAARLAGDKGFQDSLQRYQAMQAKQVKQIFMALDDRSIMDYLQAMEPRTAARIIKEFKSPEELDRIRKVLEQMRLAQAPAKE